MNKDDILWLAGLLEGEGCFSLYNDKHPKISLGMTDLDIVERAHHIMKATSNISDINRKKNSGLKKQYYFSICGNLAIQWMMTLYPLMGSRRKGKIREILIVWKNSSYKRVGWCKKGHQIIGSNIMLYRGKTYCLKCFRLINPRIPNSYKAAS